MKAATISRELGQSFAKSNTNATKVSGWTTTKEGYTAKQNNETVLVTYELGDWNKTRGEERLAARTAKLNEVAAYLTAKGYAVEINGSSSLLVSGAVA